MEKQYDYIVCEQKIRDQWESQKTYAFISSDRPVYSIDTPPPTVSGSLHIGHIFSYTQTDIIARYKRLNGFNVLYPFGFDDNGLPTERYVEKKRKIRAHTMPRSEFIAICLEEVTEVAKLFTSLWQQIGLSVDWSKNYSTISAQTRAISQASFLDLHAKGFVYRRQEPALYCSTCRTSVAQAELDDESLPSFFSDIAFKDAQKNDLVIGTTRPELLPACVALFYHPNDTRYAQLKGQFATVPIFGHQVPILADEHVDPEKGTGLVMCCTFGDKTDVAWFKKFNLPYVQAIGRDGKMTELCGLIAGMPVTQARTTIIQELEKQGLLANKRPITHSVSVHERCKKEIEYLVLSQWFINILERKQTYIDLAEKITWHPSFMKARYIDWVENLNWDWCISRQRFYGIPFPAWHCNACSAVLLAEKKDLPLDPQETTYPGKLCPACNSADIIPDADVMDTWNTSSLTPYLVADLINKPNDLFSDATTKAFIPMSMRPQAHDIIRTWAFDTIVKVWMHHQQIPWNDIIISGHVLSDRTGKLSKSKENSMLAPEQLLQQYSADAVRYWTASGGLGHDVTFSEAQIKIGQRLVTKLWNAFRFAHEHIGAINPTDTPKQLGVINEWILHQLSDCFVQYNNYFATHELGIALTHAERFFWHDLCDNYLELIKNQLFNPEKYDAAQVYATRWTLYHVGLRVLQLFAPYVPYVTEAIYQDVYKKYDHSSSLHVTLFSEKQRTDFYPEAVVTMHLVLQVVGAIRRLKSEHQLSLKVPLESLTILGTAQEVEQLQKQELLIHGATHAQQILYVKEGELEAKLYETNQQWHACLAVTLLPTQES